MYNITTVYDDGNALIQFEDLEGNRFVHITIDKLTPSVVRSLKGVWSSLEKKCIKDGFSFVRTYTQNKKFCKLATPPFKEEGVVRYNKKDYEVLRWELN